LATADLEEGEFTVAELADTFALCLASTWATIAGDFETAARLDRLADEAAYREVTDTDARKRGAARSGATNVLPFERPRPDRATAWGKARRGAWS
jgi:hypothetical protein